MIVIQLKGLTTADAEKAICRVWHVLEQHDIESPEIDTSQDGEDRVAVRIKFQRQRDADVVEAALLGWCSVAHLVPMGRRKLV